VLSIRMDAEGAELLAKQLEVALAVEGVKASENCVQAAIASLLRIENWKTLQREASKQPITLTYGNDPSESVYEVLVHAVMTLADKVLPAVHPSQLANMLDTGEELPALPLYITHAQEDPSQLRIHFNGVNTDHNQGLLGEACTLTSRDPRNLGRMLASVLCREIYLADESIEAFAYAAIEHNPATGEDELFEDDADDEREISPHCRATNEFAPYATNLRLPVPDKDFPAMRMGESGEFTVFAPYADHELMFCVIEDEELTSLPAGTILPIRWSTSLLDVISGVQGRPPIEAGQEVIVLYGIIQWPEDHFMRGFPETATVKSFASGRNGARLAKIKVKGQRKLQTVALDCLITG
jgi:hypothetical protein